MLFGGLILRPGFLAALARRATSSAARRHASWRRARARVVLALVALFVADFFASDQLNKELWLLLGLGPALLAIARREPRLTRRRPRC